MNSIISLDWLSFTGTLNYFTNEIYHPINNGKYSSQRMEKTTPHYINIDNYYKDGMLYFTILSNPRNSFLSKNSCQVKLNNELLYSQELEIVIQEIKECGVNFHCLTRIDICIDFLRFDSGLKPTNFIDKFLKNKYIKLGKSKLSVFGSHYRKIEYNALNFKNKGSNISWKLYNKSLELREVKDKYYIRQMWTEAGYQEGIDDDVWRLELSLINLSVNHLSFQENFDVFSKLEFVINPMYQQFIFNHYLDSSFRFKFNTHQKNISREKDVLLFHHNQTIFKRLKLNGFNRDNLYKRTITNLITTIGNQAIKDCEQLDNAVDTIINIVRSCELEDYLLSKYGIDIELLDKYKNILFIPEGNYEEFVFSL